MRQVQDWSLFLSTCSPVCYHCVATAPIAVTQMVIMVVNGNHSTAVLDGLIDLDVFFSNKGSINLNSGLLSGHLMTMYIKKIHTSAIQRQGY